VNTYLIAAGTGPEVLVGDVQLLHTKWAYFLLLILIDELILL